jgi:hypothetical protein
MLQWSEWHPYNAVHVVRIPGTLDFDRLKHIIGSTLESLGLTNLSLDRDHATYSYGGGPVPFEVKILAGEESPSAALSAEIERQLNTAFPADEAFSPFRFFVAPERESFLLGLAYFHAVADAESVVLLVKDLVEAYLETNERISRGTLDLHPASGDRYLGCHLRLVWRKLLALPRFVSDLRQARRLRHRNARDLHNAFAFCSLEPASLRFLKGAANAWNVTVNDLFLALLIQAVGPLALSRSKARRRRKIAVGNIVNLRKDLRVDSRRTFGLFLGSFVVALEVPSGASTRDLAEGVRRQTRLIKRKRLYLGTPLELACARLVLSLFSTEQRLKFYQKNYPLCGGITNMNLNSLWEQKSGAGPMDYFRAVSTGPVTPLVLSATTIGDRVNIGLSYRTTVYSKEEIEQIRSRFVEAVGELRRVA